MSKSKMTSTLLLQNNPEVDGLISDDSYKECVMQDGRTGFKFSPDLFVTFTGKRLIYHQVYYSGNLECTVVPGEIVSGVYLNKDDDPCVDFRPSRLSKIQERDFQKTIGHGRNVVYWEGSYKS